MALMSPFQYRLHRIREAIFGDSEIVYEVLILHEANLPNAISVAWERDKNFIVGKIHTEDNNDFVAQGRTAKEFVECVNDALFVAYEIPLKYAEALGGDFRLIPPKEEFAALNDKAIKKSEIAFANIPTVAH
ncbi:MAG: hypothetical protein U9Q03_00280 [Patescibacteria group bacterium]|nr:hypothetical protein [Patescibacteria group bacterium]